MENEDNNTYDFLLDESGNTNVGSAGDKEAVSQSDNTAQTIDAMSLDDLNKTLGKDFKDKATALKAIKDTFAYVGKKKEDVVKEVKQEIDPSAFISKDQYERDMFYSQNSEYNNPEVREVIDSMSKAKGVSPREVVNSEAFKKVYEGFKGFNESQKLKTVLETNPRLAGTTTKLGEAKQAMTSGSKEAGERLATEAVMDAYPDLFK